MNKKRMLVAVALIIVAVIVNSYVLFYREPLGNEKMDLCFTIHAEDDTSFQIFYWNQEDPDGVSFIDRRSVIKDVKYDNDVDDVYTFSVPADTTYIRFDAGSCETTSVISSVSVSYKGKILDIPVSYLNDYVELKDAEVEYDEISDSISIETKSDDSNIVYHITDWDGASIVKDYRETTKPWIIRIIKCLIIEFVFIMIFKNFEDLYEDIKRVVKNRKLIKQLSRNDFKTRYAASFFGIFWAFIQPLITVLVYWFVFEKGLKAGSQSLGSIDAPFLLFLISGLVPWFFFSDALNGATSALTSYTYLVKKVVFDIDILPLVKVLSSLYVHVFFMIMSIVICYGYGNRPTFIILQLVYYSVALMALVIGLGYLTSAVVVFFRDLSEIINIILSIGVWVTPIMWNIETTVKSDALKLIFQINPLYYIVQGYRDTLITGVWFWEHSTLTIYYWVFTVIIFVLGKRTFTKLKVHFSDVL